ncbi:unnamed protein product [Cylindrotheca closterium]|uniref:Uncharacterized protein n=1 Tax=Cylindrotheca closterium TaxID=2856 RepID=A0AAD2PW16_9STRA|nr:unnamed protein product [Cylindrotheca closterium]
MMKQKYSSVIQDSRFRGGASLVSLMNNHEAILPEFASKTALKSSRKRNKPLSVKRLLRKEWDYIIMNDQTQAPARSLTQKNTIKILKKKYLRRIQDYSPSSTVILLMTAAYKSSKVNYSSDLGGFKKFTKKLLEGYESYASVFPNAKIAPLGLGYKYIKDNYEKQVWEQLYASDGYHPSPHGTYLEACIVYCSIVGEEPPKYDEEWWDTAQYKIRKKDRPTKQEAAILHEAACQVCGIAQEYEFMFEL